MKYLNLFIMLILLFNVIFSIKIKGLYNSKIASDDNTLEYPSTHSTHSNGEPPIKKEAELFKKYASPFVTEDDDIDFETFSELGEQTVHSPNHLYLTQELSPSYNNIDDTEIDLDTSTSSINSHLSINSLDDTVHGDLKFSTLHI